MKVLRRLFSQKKINAFRRWNFFLLLIFFLGCASVLRLKVLQQEVTFIPSPFRYRNISKKHGPANSCIPETDIFFLKTHKCASSTVQNILMRYGDTRNLSFLLPEEMNYVGNPEPFSLSMLTAELTPPFGFNIFCHHTRFQANNVRSVMSVDSVFVTILRNPVDLFESLYGYYHLQKYIGLTLDEFADSDSTMTWLEDNRFADKYGNNQMLFDLGYDRQDWRDEARLRAVVGEVEKQFDFVMIAELFDESLILLKEKLCWRDLDIVYFSHNRRKHSAKRRLDSSRKERLMDYNEGDKLLYNYFYDKLQRNIENFGQRRMKREVRKLRRRNQKWYDKCVDSVNDDGSKSPDSNLRAYSDNVYSFRLKPVDPDTSKFCYKLATAEIPYTELLREKQKTLVTRTRIEDITTCPWEVEPKNRISDS